MKRLFDITASLLGLILLTPIFLIIIFLVNSRLGRPVFFIQERPGRHGRPFKMIKFRTMTNSCDSRGHLLPNEHRKTTFGNFLRSSSLDELPELINVLRGDMSLVGPRPLLMGYVMLYSDFQNRRHEVKPGITGWAQINGRNSITWEQKFAYDVWYVDNQSLWLDLKILMYTLIQVMKRNGINNEAGGVLEPFRGSERI